MLWGCIWRMFPQTYPRVPQHNTRLLVLASFPTPPKLPLAHHTRPADFPVPRANIRTTLPLFPCFRWQKALPPTFQQRIRAETALFLLPRNFFRSSFLQVTLVRAKQGTRSHYILSSPRVPRAADRYSSIPACCVGVALRIGRSTRRQIPRPPQTKAVGLIASARCARFLQWLPPPCSPAAMTVDLAGRRG